MEASIQLPNIDFRKGAAPSSSQPSYTTPQEPKNAECVEVDDLSCEDDEWESHCNNLKKNDKLIVVHTFKDIENDQDLFMMFKKLVVTSKQGRILTIEVKLQDSKTIKVPFFLEDSRSVYHFFNAKQNSPAGHRWNLLVNLAIKELRQQKQELENNVNTTEQAQPQTEKDSNEDNTRKRSRYWWSYNVYFPNKDNTTTCKQFTPPKIEMDGNLKADFALAELWKCKITDNGIQPIQNCSFYLKRRRVTREHSGSRSFHFQNLAFENVSQQDQTELFILKYELFKDWKSVACRYSSPFYLADPNQQEQQTRVILKRVRTLDTVGK